MKQELFDQEMAQCSFKPERSAGAALSRRRASTSHNVSTSSSSVTPSSYAARSVKHVASGCAWTAGSPWNGASTGYPGSDGLSGSVTALHLDTDLKVCERRRLVQDTLVFDPSEQSPDCLLPQQQQATVSRRLVDAEPADTLRPVADVLLRMEDMLLDLDDGSAFDQQDLLDGIHCQHLPGFA